MSGIALLPVIELEPGRFALKARDLPAESAAERADHWDEYWRACLADSGLSLRPMYGTWFVPIYELMSDHDLSLIIRDHFDNAHIDNGFQEFGPFEGGFALVRDREVLQIPHCGGSLGDLSEWDSASKWRSPKWKAVWIGHPYVSVRFDAGLLQISEPHIGEMPIRTRVDVVPDELVSAVEGAKRELLSFKDRMRPIVQTISRTQSPEQVLKLLIGELVWARTLVD